MSGGEQSSGKKCSDEECGDEKLKFFCAKRSSGKQFGDQKS